MSKYAIIKIGPFQFKVEEGKEYTVNKFEAEEGESFGEAEILAVADGDTITFGTPTVDGAKVEITVMEQAKGGKTVQKVFKAKSRYRRTRGHRQRVTKFKVGKITTK